MNMVNTHYSDISIMNVKTANFNDKSLSLERKKVGGGYYIVRLSSKTP